MQVVGVLCRPDPKYPARLHLRHGAAPFMRRMQEMDERGHAETVLLTKFFEREGSTLLQPLMRLGRFSSPPIHECTENFSREYVRLHTAERAAEAQASELDARLLHIDCTATLDAPMGQALTVAPFTPLWTRQERQAARQQGTRRDADHTLENLADAIELIGSSPMPVEEAVALLPMVRTITLSDGKVCNVVASVDMTTGAPKPTGTSKVPAT